MNIIDDIRDKNFERNRNILKAFGQEIEKGGKRATLGEIRTFGGREYIKTAQGWKFHGKGTGKKAKEHAEGSEEKKITDNSVVNNIINARNEEYDKEIKRIENNKERFNHFASKAKLSLSKLEPVLRQEGLSIHSVGLAKTGFGDNWEQDDYMRISLKLQPISNKVRFISHQGYDKSGRGKNDKQLRSKADRLSQNIKNVTGIDIDINHFSFQKNEKGNNSILGEFWIK